MKYFAYALLFAMAMPVALLGQSTLIFARIMEREDFSTTGLAVGNPTNSPAAVVLTLYGRDGQSLGSTTLNLPANGHAARLASELFPDMSAGGWIEGTSLNPQLSAFWLGGDFREVG